MQIIRNQMHYNNYISLLYLTISYYRTVKNNIITLFKTKRDNQIFQINQKLKTKHKTKYQDDFGK